MIITIAVINYAFVLERNAYRRRRVRIIARAEARNARLLCARDAKEYKKALPSRKRGKTCALKTVEFWISVSAHRSRVVQMRKVGYSEKGRKNLCPEKRMQPFFFPLQRFLRAHAHKLYCVRLPMCSSKAMADDISFGFCNFPRTAMICQSPLRHNLQEAKLIGDMNANADVWQCGLIRGCYFCCSDWISPLCECLYFEFSNFYRTFEWSRAAIEFYILKFRIERGYSMFIREISRIAGDGGWSDLQNIWKNFNRGIIYVTKSVRIAINVIVTKGTAIKTSYKVNITS